MGYPTGLYDKSLLARWNQHRMVTQGILCNGISIKVSSESTEIESVIEKPKNYENYTYEQHKLDQASQRKEGKHCPRWLTDDVEKMYLMPACSPAHEYICKRLDFSLHYQVKSSEKALFETALDSMKDKESCPEIVRVNDVMEKTENTTFKDEFLKATTNVPPEEVPWDSIGEAIAYLLKNECKTDEARGNISKDFGFTGDHNPDLKRNDSELRGLSCPNVHAGTFDPKLPWVKDLFCYLSKRLTKLSEDFIDDLYGNNKRTVRDRLRHKLFASKIAEENCLDAIRIALTTADVCAKDHGDIGNDASDPRYTPSGVVSFHVEIDGKLYRFAIIGYMKRSVADCLDRIEKHCDLIDDIEDFYTNVVKMQESECGPVNLIIPVTQDMPEKKVIEPSLDKFASLYSGLASGAENVLTQHFSDIPFCKQLKYACAVAIPCNFSNYPEDYWYLCELVRKDEYYLSELIQSIPREHMGDIQTCMTKCSVKNMEPLQLLNNLTIAICWIKKKTNLKQQTSSHATSY